MLVGLGACSNFDMLRSPIFTGSTNQEQIITGSGQTPLGGTYVGGTQTAGVQSGDLPPPPDGTGGSGLRQRAAALHAAASYAANGDPVPVVQLASVDSRQQGAPPTTLGEQAGACAAPRRTIRGGAHLVQSGDTAWNIAHRYGISVDELAAANGGSTTVKLGQRIVIPGGHAPQGVQVASLNPQEVAGARSGRANAGSADRRRDADAGASRRRSAARRRAAGRARAADRNRRLACAGRAAGGRREQRLSLAGARPHHLRLRQEGERRAQRRHQPRGAGRNAVKAAEDGTVIYAGNELKSYGNLVLIRHNNGWVSAYAHNSALQVKRGETVKPRAGDRALRHVRRRHHAAGAFRAPQGRDAGRSAAASDGELRLLLRSPSPACRAAARGSHSR